MGPPAAAFRLPARSADGAFGVTGGGNPGDAKGRRGGDGGRSYLRFIHLGTQMAILLVGGVFGGLWLDGKYRSSPAFTLAGSVLGIGLGMAVVIREVGGRRR